MESSDGPWDFSPSELAAEAWGVARVHRKLFFQWAVLPIVVGTVATILSTHVFSFRDSPSSASGAMILAAGCAWLFHGWTAAPYHIRLYRHVALGEAPSLFYGLQLWDERTWRLIWKVVAVSLQVFLLSMMIMVFTSVISGLALNEHGWADSSAVYKYVVFVVTPTLAWFVALYILAARVVLVGPGAALDSGYGIAEYGSFGSGGRGRIAKMMVLIWAPVTLLQHVITFGSLFLWDQHQWRDQILGVAAYAFSVYTAMPSMSASALLHKRAARFFPEMAAARKAILKEISETPSVRL